jgi:hypothetical protein
MRLHPASRHTDPRTRRPVALRSAGDTVVGLALLIRFVIDPLGEGPRRR